MSEKTRNFVEKQLVDEEIKCIIAEVEFGFIQIDNLPDGLTITEYVNQNEEKFEVYNDYVLNLVRMIYDYVIVDLSLPPVYNNFDFFKLYKLIKNLKRILQKYPEISKDENQGMWNVIFVQIELFSITLKESVLTERYLYNPEIPTKTFLNILELMVKQANYRDERYES